MHFLHSSGCIDLTGIVIPTLKAIYVPAKKAAYYEARIWSRLCHLILELPAEKAKK